jgi:H+/Cl- antiporter ClcA
LGIESSELFKKYLRWIPISILIGILAGLSVSALMFLLDWSSKTNEKYPSIVWFLPLVGFFIGWAYLTFGKDASGGNNLLIDEIHDPKKILPLRMVPFILFGTVLTHLFGGSAGRESAAVQMGATLSDQISKFIKMQWSERKILLVAGSGAAFGAVINAPIAGIIFGMEVIVIGRLKFFAIIECAIASFVAYYLIVFMQTPHSVYPRIDIPGFSLQIAFFVAIAGIIFGLASRVFVGTTHLIEKTLTRFISYSPLRPFVGGLILVFLFHLEGTHQFKGLGLAGITKGLTEPQGFDIPALKALFTSITVGSGFKGGEFVPLLFIGTTLGNALGTIIPISFKLLAAVGFAGVIAGATNTPIACSIVAMEIFGMAIAPYAIIACFMSYYFSGHTGIYKTQRLDEKRHQFRNKILNWFGELPKRFIKK